MSKSEVLPNLVGYELQSFDVQTLVVDSKSLKDNPLGDLAKRYNPVLVPKGVGFNKTLPTVLVLSGFTGNGPKYFAPKGFERNMIQDLDHCMASGQAPQARFVFVDAWSFWGGSQFINSVGCGNYEQYILNDLMPAIKSQFATLPEAKNWAVAGGSSGGYGALHLLSKEPNQFGLAIALSPDSLFERSLLPEIYEALPTLIKYPTLEDIRNELISGKLTRRRNWHTVVNVIGMAMCYSPTPIVNDHINLPVDTHTGDLHESKWNQWLKHDSVVFLGDRVSALNNSHKVYLDVGKRDQFKLQYGARKIKTILEPAVDLTYAEYSGDHFDISLRRPVSWKWLAKQWK